MSGGGWLEPADYFWIYGPDLEREEAAQNVSSFAYYTDAATAKLVLRSHRVWMRGVKHLNDSSEVVFGLHLMEKALASPEAKALTTTMNSLHAGSGTELATKLERMGATLLDEVFVSCVSAHNAEENEIGRLSMWRAYGKGNGVAIVVKKAALLDWSDLPVHALPVRYGKTGITGETLRNLDTLIQDALSLGEFFRNELVDLVTAALQMQIVQCKHKAFSEEREWRIIYLPNNQTLLNTLAFSPERLTKKNVELTNVLQTIYELPIVPRVIHARDASFNDIIECILIGPAKDQAQLREEFVRILDELEVDDPERKVVSCDVPLRV